MVHRVVRARCALAMGDAHDVTLPFNRPSSLRLPIRPRRVGRKLAADRRSTAGVSHRGSIVVKRAASDRRPWTDGCAAAPTIIGRGGCFSDKVQANLHDVHAAPNGLRLGTPMVKPRESAIGRWSKTGPGERTVEGLGRTFIRRLPEPATS